MSAEPASIARLKSYILETIDNPARIMERDRNPSEGPVEFAGHAAICAIMIEIAAEKTFGDTTNWKPTGFLGTVAPKETR